MKSTVKPALWFVAALTLTALVAPCAGQQIIPEQQGGTGERRTPRDTGQAARQVARELEAARRLWGVELEESRRLGGERPDQRLVFAQISEDFLRIQIVNDELARALEPTGPLDFKLIAQAASEIKKRAGRLKYNLALPEPAERVKRPKLEVETGAQLRAALTTLGPLIAGFAHNPIFKETKVLDAQLSTKARCDLEEIIELSSQVKKSSEQLSKAAIKTQ